MMSQKLINLSFAVTMSLIIWSCSEKQDSIPFRESLREANVTLNTMHDGQHESMILGNGDLYGIVWEKGQLPVHAHHKK